MASPSSKLCILLVEDDEMDQEAIERMITSFDRLPEGKLPVSLHIASSLDQAGEVLSAHPIDITLLDLGLPNTDGLDTLASFRSQNSDVPVILLTGRKDPMTTLAAAKAGAQDYLVKGQFQAEGLFRCLLYASERIKLQRELKESLEVLRASEKRLRTVINNNTEGIVLFSEEGVVLFLNPAAHQLLGWNVRDQIGDIIGRPFTDGRVTELTVVETGDSRDEVTTVELRIGETQWSGVPAFIAWLRDISAQRRGERYLLEAKLAAEQASRIKTAFLANVTRQVRTPVEEVLGLADLLLADPLIRQAAHPRRVSVQTIHKRAESLVKLLDDLSDLASLEAADVEIQPKVFDLFAIVRESLIQVQPRAKEKRNALKLEFDGPVPDRIQADDRRVQQILNHLLDNAVRFTTEGNITLKLGLTTDTADRPQLFFSVTDTGCGIEPELLGRLFDPFAPYESVMAEAMERSAQHQEHSGLGLAISQRLAGIMGGDIVARSAIGEGSEFRLRLPVDLRFTQTFMDQPFEISEEIACSATSATSIPLKNRRVLVLVDSLPLEHILHVYLQQAGLECEFESKLETAVARASERQAQYEPFDLILMDANIGSGNGIGAARAFKEQGNDRPILLMALRTVREQSPQRREVGIRGVVTKPVKRDELLALIGEVLSLR